MTARGFFSVGISDLTELNQRLIAAASVPGVVFDTGNPIIGGPGGDEPTGRPEDPDAGAGAEVRGRMSSADPFEFYRIREWIKQEVFGGDLQGMSIEVINAFINEWDEEVRRELGLAPEEEIDRGATLEELLNRDDQKFLQGASWLPVTGRGLLPPIFTTSTEVPTEEGGAQEVPVVGIANPLTGVEFVEASVEVASNPKNWATAAGLAWRKIIAQDPFSDISSGLIEGARQARIDISGGNMGRVGLVAPDAMDPGDWQLHVARFSKAPRKTVPHIPKEQLLELRRAPEDRSRTSTTTTRRDITFDRNHLVAQVENLWHSWFFEPGEAPRAKVESVVDGYVREARAFWRGKGGQLDFDTYVRNKLREEPRWKQIFGKKLPGQSEEDFIASFQQPIARLGQSAEFTREQTVAALQSGGSPTEQLRRVVGTREVQMSGGFSQRLAQTLRGIGVG